MPEKRVPPQKSVEKWRNKVHFQFFYFISISLTRSIQCILNETWKCFVLLFIRMLVFDRWLYARFLMEKSAFKMDSFAEILRSINQFAYCKRQMLSRYHHFKWERKRKFGFFVNFICFDAFLFHIKRKWLHILYKIRIKQFNTWI